MHYGCPTLEETGIICIWGRNGSSHPHSTANIRTEDAMLLCPLNQHRIQKTRSAPTSQYGFAGKKKKATTWAENSNRVPHVEINIVKIKIKIKINVESAVRQCGIADGVDSFSTAAEE